MSDKLAARKWGMAAVCAGLVAVTFLVFWQTYYHGFVNYDDDDYVYNNPIVSKGLTVAGIGWAFTHVHASNWHPVTTMTHMLDCQVYGLEPGGHHLTNVVLHAACAVLLFLMLSELTGAYWRSAFVAGVFAIHPLRVESVAWIAERKDVLSGVFFMLTLWAYARYAKGGKSKWSYALVVVWLALGLMSKPMLVTTPFVLLLLDYWPLGRLRDVSQLAGLVREKISLFVLSILSCVATVFAQKGTMELNEHVGFSLRVCNALVAYVVYMGKLIYPVRLAVLYPFVTMGLPVWEVCGAVLILGGVAWIAYKMRSKQPWIVVGLLWYLGMLTPVIGIAQVGQQAYADRYTYLPEIGLCVALTWGLVEGVGRWKYKRVVLGGAAAVVLSILVTMAYRQTSYWRNSLTLWSHTVECTEGNSGAQNNLGLAYAERGALEEAMAHYREAVRINPNYAKAYVNLGSALLVQGRVDEAIGSLREAVRLAPTLSAAQNNLGFALAREGQNGEAIEHYREALHISPGMANAHNNLGNALMAEGQTVEAIKEYREAVRINAGYTEAEYNLAIALAQAGQMEGAIDVLNVVIQREPNNVAIESSLAWMLATAPERPLRNGARAVQLATQASEAAGGKNAMLLRTLAAADAAAGKFAEATQTAGEALQVAGSDAGLAEELRREMNLYKAGRGYEDAR
jgi:tetratricopeptide (TPR) repeat protein